MSILLVASKGTDRKAKRKLFRSFAVALQPIMSTDLKISLMIIIIIIIIIIMII